jgi:hypothetical protein
MLVPECRLTKKSEYGHVTLYITALSLRCQAGSILTAQEKYKKTSIGLGKEDSGSWLETLEERGRLHYAGHFVDRRKQGMDKATKDVDWTGSCSLDSVDARVDRIIPDEVMDLLEEAREVVQLRIVFLQLEEAGGLRQALIDIIPRAHLECWRQECNKDNPARKRCVSGPHA